MLCGIVGVLAECCNRLVNHIEYKVNSMVEHSLVKCAVLDSLDDKLCAVARGCGHLDFLTGNKSGYTLVFRAPVGNYKVFVAEVLTQNVGKKPFILGAVIAVKSVVCVHYRPGLCLSDGNLKRTKIDFTKRSLINNGVDGHTAGFLIVGGIVLKRGAYSLGLNAVDKRGSHLAGKLWILGEILKVSAAEG